jgi:NhaA family Na+:H+ antiporter
MAKLINIKPFKRFFSSQSNGGIILMLCVVISLIIANSSLGSSFNDLLSNQFGFENDYIELKYSLLLWINDGLMAIFFLMVGLEIKRELVEGELSSIKQASLPIIAALGGMLVPALIYSLIDNSELTGQGWGIPMATDIAFAIAIITMLGDKVPNSLKIFLTALAIVDDLGAILVIAIFYSTDIHFNNLLYAGLILFLLVCFNYFGVKKLYFYIIPGVFIWYFIHHSGIHATIAGVLTAFTIPTNTTSEESPLERLEHLLSNPVNFLIMPIFAIANTNIKFESSMFTNITTGLSAAIICGLLIGKPLGILSFSWLAVKIKLSKLPKKVNWKHITSIGLLGGIGFTMSIFIALLSLPNSSSQMQAKFSILIASVSAGILGYTFLYLLGKRKKISKSTN